MGVTDGISVPLDENCTLSTCRVWVDPHDGTIYDAYLNLCDSFTNKNKFYRIQVLEDTNDLTYKTWTRWGRVGENGRNAVLGDGTRPDAINIFKKKFRDKSGHTWDDRSEAPNPEKYTFVECRYDNDLNSDDTVSLRKTAVNQGLRGRDQEQLKCTLQPPVADLMRLIFNKKHLQQAMTSLNYDATGLPLGKLSKSTIAEGFKCLKELAAILDGDDTTYSLTSSEIKAISNRYYSFIPHKFGRKTPPPIVNETMLTNELDLLGSLSEMKEAAAIMKTERKSGKSMHPLDHQFQGLGLQEMTPLTPNSEEFYHIVNYLRGSCGATHDISYDVRNIFRVERKGESKRFGDFDISRINPNRRLLWHGSRVTNYAGILRQGLRIAPREAPVTGYMFGKGIYLADMSSKSAGY
ncbi:unnamed protein product, partial [Fusarium langsethiae]